MKKQKKIVRADWVESYFSEKNIMIKLKSKFIMPFYFAMESANHVYYVMEVAPCEYNIKHAINAM